MRRPFYSGEDKKGKGVTGALSKTPKKAQKPLSGKR